jgi:FtsH-binding integral membrane protein
LAAAEPLSINMRAAIALLEIFVIAVVLAFLITVDTGSSEMQLLAMALVGPIIILGVIFIYYCRKRRVWSFAGALVLALVGVILRVVVSTQPNLEVGGGLPVGVTVLYIVLGSLLALKSYESLLELRMPDAKSARRAPASPAQAQPAW